MQSLQVQPYCFHYQLNFVGNLLLVCLKHPWSPKISNKFDQQNTIYVEVCEDDRGEIFQLSVSG